MERLLVNLNASAAEFLVEGYVLPTTDGYRPGLYEVTRIVAERNEVYGKRISAEVPPRWWEMNREVDTLPFNERRFVPQSARKKRKKARSVRT